MKKTKLLGLLAVGLIFIGCSGLGGGRETSEYNVLMVHNDASTYPIYSTDIGTFKHTTVKKHSHRAAVIEEMEANAEILNKAPGNKVKDPQMYKKPFDNINLIPRIADDDNSDDNDNGTTPVEYKTGDTKNFYVVENPNSNSYKFKSINSTLMSIGEYCYVWIDSSMKDEFTTSDFDAVAEKFDTIYPYETNLIGKNYVEKYQYKNLIQPTENDKINIFIHDIGGDKDLADNDSNKNYIVGYFYSLDMYQPSYLEKNMDSYKSNGTEIFYVDSWYFKEDAEDVYSTLAHEFNHMLNFVNKTMIYRESFSNSDNYNYGSWFTEMLSMCTEDVMQELLDVKDYDSPKVRLNYFNVYAEKGFMDTTWDNENFSIAYANTYAFGAYLMRNYGGIELLHEIATNNDVEENAITTALKKLGYNETFDSVVSKFGQIFLNVDGSDSTLCTMNKSSSYELNNFSYNIPKIDLSKNYYAGYVKDDVIGDNIRWYSPMVYSYEDVLNENAYLCLLKSGFFIVNFESTSDDWTLDNIKNKNERLSYYLY